MFLHRLIPDGPPGHTEIFYEDIDPFDDPAALGVLMASAGHERSLLDLRTADLTGIDRIMAGHTPNRSTPGQPSTR